MPEHAGQIVKPNLFIVGAPKCGTTAWHAYLGSHPDIFFSEVKEPNYFATDLPGMRRCSTKSDYEKLFIRGKGAKAVGEASGIYMYSADAARAIREYNPDARILIFLRDQEHFVPSLHHQLFYKFVEPIEDFETAWRLSGNRPADTIPKTCPEPKVLDYVARGRFYEQVSRYFDAFPPEQIRVFGFDEWTSDPRSVYLQILDFLGLEDDDRTSFPQKNEAKSYPIKWLGRLIAHPPRFARAGINLLKKLTGRSAFGIGAKAADLLTVKGYRTSIPPELRVEIGRFYEAENRLLDELLASRAVR